VLRTLLKPRWLGLSGLLVVLLAAFAVLGLWQLSVAKDEARKAAVEEAPRQPVVPLTSVLTPHGEFPATASGRRVEAVGSYDAAGQVLVVGRRLDGAAGYWVVTPLVVSDTGARLAILRGFVRMPQAPAPRTAAQVTVVGSIAPGESPGSSSTPLPPRQLPSVDLGHLVNQWDGPIYNAFLFAISETPDASAAGPAGSSATGALERVPPPPVPSGLTFRNAAYALQWWVFGLFAIWMWWKMVREDHLRDLARRREVGSDLDAEPAGAPRP
jgi:cytochrome oxidase assembly protein ShyY1